MVLLLEYVGINGRSWCVSNILILFHSVFIIIGNPLRVLTESYNLEKTPKTMCFHGFFGSELIDFHIGTFHPRCSIGDYDVCPLMHRISEGYNPVASLSNVYNAYNIYNSFGTA